MSPARSPLSHPGGATFNLLPISRYTSILDKVKILPSPGCSVVGELDLRTMKKDAFENILGKGENAGYPECFQNRPFSESIKL